jgi:hypothetical protein
MEQKPILSEYLIKCLSDLVGITRTQCDCYGTLSVEKQALIAVSRSGLYIDEDPRLNNCLLLKNSRCGVDDIFDKISRVREQAITELTLAIATKLQNNYQAKVDKTISYGNPSYGSLLTNTLPGKKSFLIETNNIVGGIIHLQYVGFVALLPTNVWSENVRINVDKIDKQGVRESLYFVDYRIDNQTSWMGKKPKTDYSQLPDDGIELLCDGSNYEIWYDYDPTKFIPYSNEVACGGCQKSKIETSIFYSTPPQGEAFGMLLSARIYCDPLSIVCGMVKRDNLLAMLVANGIVYKTLEFLIFKLRAENSGALRTPQILQIQDKPTTDQYTELVIGYGMAFQQVVDSIVDKLLLYDTKLECFTCRKNQYASRTGMLQ